VSRRDAAGAGRSIGAICDNQITGLQLGASTGDAAAAAVVLLLLLLLLLPLQPL
jgi:hypothetical protein